MGFCLKQAEHGKLYPISYGSRKLTRYEQGIISTECQLRAFSFLNVGVQEISYRI